METEQEICSKERKFVKHPDSIEMVINNTIDSSKPHDNSCNGLLFKSSHCYRAGQKINLTIDLGQMRFNGNARISWCKKNKLCYDVGIEFLESCNAFEVKMALQVCQIKDFIEHKEMQESGKETTQESTCEVKKENNKACEWILKNASSF